MARLDWYIRAGLKFRHLQLLVALDDYRNLSKVASLLNVTQPALSKTLAELQENLGVQLFERTGRGLKPTAYAACLIGYVRKILADLGEAGDELHALSTSTSRKVRIGTLPATASWLLPDALALLKQESPNTSIFLREASADILLNELRLGNIDMIVGTLPPRKINADLDEQILYADASVLVVRVGHPLAIQTDPVWSQLGDFPWVLPPPDSLLRQPLLVELDAHGIRFPNNYIETISHNVTLNFVQMTQAIACLPSTLAKRYAAKNQIAILPLKLSQLVRPVGVVWRRERAMLPGMTLMISYLEKVIENLE